MRNLKKILHRLEQMQKGLNEQMPSKKQKTNVKRNERVRKMRRKRRIKFLLAFLAVCLIVFAVLSITVLFPITKIVTSDCGKYKAEEILKIRKSTGMSQRLFAGYLGVSVKTVEAWESGTNHPSGTASRILNMIEMNGNVIREFPFVQSIEK